MGFGYLQAKAIRYVKVGPERYRRHDFFSRPDTDMSQEDLAILHYGMSQIVDGIGTSPDRPLTGLGIRGFNDMIYTFHLETVRQEIVGSTEWTFLDQMTCRHIIMNDVIELYNLVPKPNSLPATPFAPWTRIDN